MTRTLLLLLIISLSSISCERTGKSPNSSPDISTTEKTDLTHLDHLRAQHFIALDGSTNSTCIVRDERRFSACPECFIACLQDPGTPQPSGLYLGPSPVLSDFPHLRAYEDALIVEDRVIVDLHDDDVHSDQIHSELLVEPLLQDLQDVAHVNQAQAELMGESYDPTLYVLIDPDYPWRLMLQVFYTASQAGLKPVLIHRRDEDITRLSIGCQGSDDDEALFESDQSAGEEFRGVTYLCTPEEQERRYVPYTDIEFWVPKAIQQSWLPDAPYDLTTLFVTLDDQKIQLTERSGAESLLSTTDGDMDIADEECIDDEWTFCVSEDGHYDFAQLSAKAARWLQEHPESRVIIAAEEDLTTGTVQQAIAALLHRGEEELFSDFAVAIIP